MAAALPLVLAAGAITLVMVGRNIDSISPTAGHRLDELASSARAAVSSVGTGLQAQVNADKSRSKKGGAARANHAAMAVMAALVVCCSFIG